ncbi:hypothetical protein [Hymenobacter armeniacus]|uniref:Uncharacterized protein n=1 Tax=Hymenobacter armeniacus TaxID=2771358 RepID=A0ABR8JMB6_9BACT|nr:hypothetical protein [Hymenobacter armeniacus]MBD2721118.1 hypothetical protein [Hymenobacter armeniacus]
MALSFNPTTYAQQLDAQSGITLKNTDNGQSGWLPKDSTSPSTNNLVLEYVYQKDSNDDKTNYRTWYPETSLMKDGAGLIVSAKIDHIRGDSLDDHIILICGFNAAAELVVAQASVQITKDSKYNQTVPPQTLAMARNDPGNIDNLVYDLLHAVDFHDYGRNTIDTAVKYSIIAIRKSVTKA